MISKLENEYEKQIEAKVKEACKLLLEANKLVKKAKIKDPDSYGFEDEYGDEKSSEFARNLSDFNNLGFISSLYDTLDKCGWRTSSFGC